MTEKDKKKERSRVQCFHCFLITWWLLPLPFFLGLHPTRHLFSLVFNPTGFFSFFFFFWWERSTCRRSPCKEKATDFERVRRFLVYFRNDQWTGNSLTISLQTFDVRCLVVWNLKNGGIDSNWSLFVFVFEMNRFRHWSRTFKSYSRR